MCVCNVKDVRMRSVNHVYTDDSPVRDVQLNPHNPVNFATACEDGSIRVCLPAVINFINNNNNICTI